MSRIGTIFSPYPHPPEELREAARVAEGEGVPELWLWEDCFRSSAWAAAAAALAATDHLRVGVGIAPFPLRNVAASAMEVATIERMFPGRLLPGFGHGVQDWMRQIGAKAASPLTLMQEQLPALRGLLAGDTVSAEGRYVKLRDVSLDWPPVVAPRVYAAAEGPKTLRLAGAVADGVILDSRHTVDEVAEAVRLVRAGWAEAGRGGSPDIVAYVLTAFGSGATERVGAVLEDRPDAADRALAGTVGEVAEGVARFQAAGVDDVVLLPTDDVDLHVFFSAVGQVAAEVPAAGGVS
ncbi:MAG: N5,N10-methylene tetrahydromethanopterin reductase [Microbacterium sp. 71-36]|uniref:LLM class flavin-dependent oxidoreductase n=1 Tax=unclassified Microbacterium TaxID=2609290 RepID=UPI00086D9F1C|nr:MULTISPECIES: LLM class flavin-dependent oxidoreductase [unclassified Microbacterium]MBN9211647.1 LLM class flavin-dependent oxidoreductase [Microbacterium sp.]ODT37475.1 MAG: N5,N10-methylene tetrahydromethanopterin reductase [Microbacterium sp. SCN 71-17]ODU51665.1 MAG: N5,N10-methylene tetrahydromethanopterin reductase [Microbacterium sp. SCN 70-10]OJV77503.1 MAG: N5,N10-methylene tetrahydromethanopterin reductase [Microbacterium sp. 71-36]